MASLQVTTKATAIFWRAPAHDGWLFVAKSAAMLACSEYLLYILGGEGEGEILQELGGFFFGRGFSECGSEGCKGRELLKVLVCERMGQVARCEMRPRVICESQSG